MTKINRTHQQLADQTLLTGIQSNAQSFPLLTVGGKTVTVAEAIATLQGRIDSGNRVASTRTSWQAAVKAEQDELAASNALVLGLRHALQAAFADAPEALGKYGLKPRKVAAVSVQTRVAAAAKAKATRAARHTMGPKQKQAVKGDVTDVTIAPVIASGSSQPLASVVGATPAPASPSTPATTPSSSGATVLPAKLG